MGELWFRKLGFGSNPFSIKPAAFSYELVGVNIGNVLSGIETGRVIFVEAPLGYGKTTLLRHIINRFGGRGKVVYVHAVPSEGLGVKSLLQRSSFASYISGTIPKGMILVVDEAQNILQDSSAEVAEFYKEGNLKAVVFFGTSYSEAKKAFAGGLAGLMNGNVVRLSRPTPEQAIQIIRLRIGNLPVLSNDAILAAYRRSGGRPRLLLQLCEDLCRDAVGSGRLCVSVEDVQEKAKPGQAVMPRRKRAIRKQPSTPLLAAVAVLKAERRPAAAKPDARKKQAKKAKSGSKPDAKQQPSKPQPVSVHAGKEHSEHIEGDYWGEFMGMQK